MTVLSGPVCGAELSAAADAARKDVYCPYGKPAGAYLRGKFLVMSGGELR